tara:strand:+ start:252 stop:581 length:330 start_codon:yes stop_codon:yes gene_type:complete
MSWNKQQIKHLRNTAVRSLFPDGQYNVSAEGVVEFLDGNSVTEEEIVAEEKRILKEWNDTEYQRNRSTSYPSIQDVVVALAEKEEGDDAMWQKITAQRAKVKADNPKPE